MTARKMVAALAGALWLAGMGGAQAHPHAWIDVSVEVLFDPAGKVTALREHWLFDEFYTADTVQKGERQKMELLTTRILRNLKEYGYFTRVQAGGRAIALKEPTERAARLDGQRLLMTFQVPLAEPVAAPLSYSVFDPTYYIEMLHAESPDAVRLVGAPAGCRSELLPAKPDGKAVALASALDRTQSGGDGLGALFAETVEVRCDPAR